MVLTKTFTLNTGAKIPQLALGTWQATDEECYNSVIYALKAGYRHIDTAALYKNEVPVGRAVRESGIPREEIFVTTKLYETQHRYAKDALDASLEKLGLDYVDLYLMHWPVSQVAEPTEEDPWAAKVTEDGKKALDPDWDFVKTWALMQDLLKSGKAKAIGVSNFSINNIEQLLAAETTTIIPAANQCECHPLLPQTELIEYCKSKGIVFEAYCPMGAGNSSLLTNDTIKSIADKYGVSTGEVMLNWAFKRDYVVLPKSSNPSRIVKNGEAFDLKEEDFDKISELSKTLGEFRLVKREDVYPFPIFQ